MKIVRSYLLSIMILFYSLHAYISIYKIERIENFPQELPEIKEYPPETGLDGYNSSKHVCLAYVKYIVPFCIDWEDYEGIYGKEFYINATVEFHCDGCQILKR